MKTIVKWSRLVMVAAMAMQFSLVSCKKENNEDTTSAPPTSGTGLVTPVGVSDGQLITKKVGAAGGKIESADGRLTVEIPAGALSSEVTIGLEPITNECPMASGTQAFRLTPHGQLFSKPATITVKYGNEDLNGTIPMAFGIAYQNEKNIWMMAAGRSVDTVAQTVSIQTTHFSDWSFITGLKLLEPLVYLDPGATTKYKIRTAHYDEMEELLVPLGSDKEWPIDPQDVPDDKFIGGWQLAGEGSLSGSGHTVTYQAPSKLPRSNPAVISVTIKSKGKAIGILVARAYTISEGISVSIDGGPFKTYKNCGANITSSASLLNGGNTADRVSIMFQGNKPGNFSWTLTTVSFINTTATTQIHSLYGTEPNVSGGSLNVEEIREVGGYVIGTFTIEPAGKYEITVPPSISTCNVKGFFMVRRLS